jgi:hypothetical protein
MNLFRKAILIIMVNVYNFMESVLRCENATLQLERETKHLMLMKAIKAYKRT